MMAMEAAEAAVDVAEAGEAAEAVQETVVARLGWEVRAAGAMKAEEAWAGQAMEAVGEGRGAKAMAAVVTERGDSVAAEGAGVAMDKARADHN